MTAPWRLTRGATVTGDGGVRFSVWAPHAKRVTVSVDAGGRKREHRLERLENGVHEGHVPDVGAGSTYLYRLDDKGEFPDPVSRFQPDSVFGPSAVVAPRAFSWSDREWSGIALCDYVIYEVHVGAATKEGTFDALCGRFEYLRDLGVTAVELMPVAQFSGSRNWGYDGVFPYAPQDSYGGPEGLRRLVDRAHKLGLAVILDVVYNHLGPEGNVLHEYGPYFTDRYQTPWGKAMNFDGPDSDEVRRYFIDNALYWITEFHIDALRLDAVHAICDFSAVNILDDISRAVHEQQEHLGRRAYVIAESDLNDPRLVRPRSRGGYGLDGQWNDDFHHAVHAAVTGEQSGYYGDFEGVGAIGKALRDRFVLDGTYSAFRRRRHGAPAGDLSPDRFVAFIQNHDQVGNRATGERLATLVSLERQKIAAFLLLLSPYIPLTFMGEEYGETNPFLYFVSHNDPQLVEAVRHGRRNEFRAFNWTGEIPDPQAEETFARSRPAFDSRRTDEQEAMARLYRDLLRLRREHAALTPGAAEVRVQVAEGQCLAWALERSGGARVVAMANLAQEPRELSIPGGRGAWSLLVATTDGRYGGAGSPIVEAPDLGADGLARVRLPAECAAAYGVMPA